MRARSRLAVILFALVAAGSALAAPQALREAWRRAPTGAEQQVTLPDEVEPARPGEPAEARYRLLARLEGVPQTQALYLPGLLAQARIRVNGHVVFDTLQPAPGPLPRSADRIRLLRLPDEFLRAGPNEIEVEARGARYLSLSPVWVGDAAALERLWDQRLLGAVIGPGIVAMVMACLAVCVLVLWWHRPRERLYGYFGAGALCWGLHSAWTVLPTPLLSGVHLPVWWTSLYCAFVMLLVIFCVRFAGWDWPRFERLLWGVALAAPPALYAAAAAGRLAEACEAWRLACIAMVAVAVVAVGVYAARRRNLASALLLLSGAVSLTFGLRDWSVAHAGADNNPVYLTPYAGLFFVVLVAWLLIDGFVQATRALERANAGLEAHVARKSAALRAALEEMRAARDQALAADQAKSRFLAAASHDLRQPVHAIGLYLAAIPEGAVPAAVGDTLQRVRTSLRTLGGLFDALLDVSRMDAGVVVPQPQPLDLDALLRRLGDEFAPLAEDKGLRLLLHGDPRATGRPAWADPLLVERVVRNLLSNAIKYTDHGGVLLAWRLRRAGRPCWRLEVRDTGRGIEAALQPRVFDEFFRGPVAGGGEGLGLGLAIVQRLTRLMDLPLTLHSEPGRGTRLRLALPLAGEAAPPRPARRAPHAAAEERVA